jgi:hypothetical protein
VTLLQTCDDINTYVTGKIHMPGLNTESQRFTTLLLSLPAHHSTVRMRLWRALKSTGCGVLRDGVYILPPGSTQSSAFAAVEAEVKAAGGFAMTAELALKDAAQLDHARSLFDRSGDYGALVQRISQTNRGLKRLGKRKAQTALQRLRRAFDDLAAIDFYPGESQVQAKGALISIEREAQELFSEGEPHVSRARLRQLDSKEYRGRIWATRKAPWVDRLACAWLIRRSIDRNAKFLWLEHPSDCPKRAVSFDFDGAEFTHVGHRVTFEVLLATFALADDPALVAIGAAVHFLDIGGISVPDAKGLETLLMGLREQTRNDDDMVREASKIFDLLYAGYRRQNEHA